MIKLEQLPPTYAIVAAAAAPSSQPGGGMAVVEVVKLARADPCQEKRERISRHSNTNKTDDGAAGARVTRVRSVCSKPIRDP